MHKYQYTPDPGWLRRDIEKARERWRTTTLANLHDERRRVAAKLAAIDFEIDQLKGQ